MKLALQANYIAKVFCIEKVPVNRNLGLNLRLTQYTEIAYSSHGYGQALEQIIVYAYLSVFMEASKSNVYGTVNAARTSVANKI